MFQWLSAACASKSVVRFSSYEWVVLILLVFQFSGVAVAGNLPPEWTVPVHQTSEDGYALLAWEEKRPEKAGFFKITETFKEKVSVHYTESTELKAWRVEPGEYEP